jgi:hypothetical protein
VLSLCSKLLAQVSIDLTEQAMVPPRRSLR